MLLAISTFLLSLFGIVGLFALKEWETKRNRTFAPEFREKADRLAFRIKDLLVALEADVERFPPEILHLARVLLHEIAVGLAATLRFLSIQAHRLADFVSHKHSFQRRAPRSEFLKKVLEHKKGGGERNE